MCRKMSGENPLFPLVCFWVMLAPALIRMQKMLHYQVALRRLVEPTLLGLALLPRIDSPGETP
jgi:hypothetical protein